MISDPNSDSNKIPSNPLGGKSLFDEFQEQYKNLKPSSNRKNLPIIELGQNKKDDFFDQLQLTLETIRKERNICNQSEDKYESEGYSDIYD